MGFEEGEIVLDSDTGIYYAGQTVFGKLIFDQENDITFRGIYVEFKGYCKVHWRTSNTMILNGKQLTTSYVNHDSYEDYINEKVYLVGSENGEYRIPSGHYECPFEFDIPLDCPSSLESKMGHIRYEVIAVMDSAFSEKIKEKKTAIHVNVLLDLNSEPDVKEMVVLKFDEKYYTCCVRVGVVRAVVRLPAAGYCPGQAMPIEISCINSSSIAVESITFLLKKKTTFHAQGTKTESEVLEKLEVGDVAAGRNRHFTTEMLVPSINAYDVRNCRYIDIDYYIKVTLSPGGCHKRTSKSHGIIIGTIPLHSYAMDDKSN